MKKHLAADTFKADADDLRRALSARLAVDHHAVNLCDPFHHMLLQLIQMLQLLLMIPVHLCRRYAKTCHTRYIFRTGAHTLLLAASIDQWSDLHFFIDIQETNALWSVDLVSTDA